MELILIKLNIAINTRIDVLMDRTIEINRTDL